MNQCEYEKEVHCLLNECIYGDFLVLDDNMFNSGRYCLCDNFEDIKEKKNE